MLNVLTSDVLALEADALVVPIDGTMRPDVEHLERILGNVGRQFLRRFPDAELLDALEGQLDLPLPLGKAASIEIQGAPFRVVVVVSTLHHAQPLDGAGKATIARTAFANALREAARAGAKSLATAVLQGGWRLSPQEAFGAMLQAILQSDDGALTVDVCCLDAALADALRGQAQSLGFSNGGGGRAAPRPIEIRFYSVTDEHGEFSNFAPYPIKLEGKVWPTSEHYFQAQKLEDPAARERIRRASTPMEAARMGRSRKLRIRRDWEAVKVDVMRRAVQAKLAQHADLAALLLATGEAELVEHTPDDAFWGDGGDGSGRNMLGRILMEVRASLRGGQSR